MPDNFMTEDQVLQALQISKQGLMRYIAEGKLTAIDQGGVRKFAREDVQKLVADTEQRATIMAGGIDLDEFDIIEDASLGGYMTIEDAMQNLQCSRGDIDELISEGRLTPIRDAGTIKFQVADVKKLAKERQQQATEFAAGAESYLTYDQALQELQCSRQELDKLIADGALTGVNVHGEQRLAAQEVRELSLQRQKRSTVMRQGAEQSMTEEEVIQELGVSKSELQKLVGDGRLTVSEDGGVRYYDPGEVYLLRRQLRPSTVIDGATYVSYDEALQELQTSRTELDRLVSEGRLKPYKDQAEIKFRADDVVALKESFEKRATILESGGVGEGAEDLFLIDEDAESVTLDSVLMEGEGQKQVRPTDIVEGPEEVEPKVHDKGTKVDLGAVAEKDTDQTSVIPVTEGEVKAADEESIFDFGEEDLDLDSSDSSVVDIKVEVPAEEQQEKPQDSSSMLEIGSGLGLDADESGDLIQIDEEVASSEILPLEEESDESSADSDIMTDVLQVGEEESSQEDILGDLLEVEETEPATTGATTTAPAFEETVDITETADVTADITQLDEETYEGTDLSEVLGTEEEVSEALGAAPAPEAEAEFAPGPYVGQVSYAEPAVISPPWVVAMLATFVLMVLCGLFVFEQAINPDYSTGWLTPFKSIVESFSK